MTQKFNVFVSSVQKELENERVTVQDLLKSDQVLAFHYTPVLYEYEPASPEIARQGCIELWIGPRAVPARSAQKHSGAFGNPERPGAAQAAASRDGSRSVAVDAALS